jgi:threonine synthase
VQSAQLSRNAAGYERFTYDSPPGLIPVAGQPITDMWRYRALLPIPSGPVLYPLTVGGTPLVSVPDLRDHLAMPALWVKDETRGPSRSNKDRATALVMEVGLRTGATVVTTSSTGNAARATAIGADAAGLRAVIFVPDSCRPAKVAAMRAAGATVFRVVDGYRAAFELSRTAAREYGWLDRNTGVSPLTTEGKKTVAFEVWEQLGRRAPDVLVAPVGDGVTLVALAKGFQELRACGVLARVPRIVGVQATCCQPLARTWRGERPSIEDASGTCADGIAVPEPVIGTWAVDEVRASGGSFVTVDDSQITDAIRLLGRMAGIGSEPAGAAALAGLIVAAERHIVDAAETVVVLATGGDAPVGPGRSGAPRGREFVIRGHLTEVEELVHADGSMRHLDVRIGSSARGGRLHQREE